MGPRRLREEENLEGVGMLKSYLEGVDVSEDGTIYQYGNRQRLTVNARGYEVFRHGTTGAVVYAHRVIASALIANYSQELSVNHKDGDKTNNAIANLECISIADNIRHAWNTGLMNRRFSAADISAIFDSYGRGESMSSIGRRVGVSRVTIRRILAAEAYSCFKNEAADTGVRRGSRHWNSTMDDATRRRIVFMRGMAMGIPDIAKITGVTYYAAVQVCSLAKKKGLLPDV